MTRRFLAADDDDEDFDDDDLEEKGPLSDGVDSVSWLPSVVGAKGDNMPITSSTKEVSRLKSVLVALKTTIAKDCN